MDNGPAPGPPHEETVTGEPLAGRQSTGRQVNVKVGILGPRLLVLVVRVEQQPVGLLGREDVLLAVVGVDVPLS